MENTVKIMVCADVATHNCKDDVDTAFCKPLLRDMKPVLDAADFRLANLECVLCEEGVGQNIIKSGPNLRGEPKNIAFLTEAGIDCAVLANNHLGDLGEDGVRATLSLLEQNNINYIGGGRNITEAYRAWYAEKNGLKIAFLAVCENEFGGATDHNYGSAVFSMKRLCDRIAEEKSLSDFVVVLFHGGHEYFPLPSPEVIDRYRLIVDMGADAVVAGHTHCIQGFETYNGHPIIYSMGNYFFKKFGSSFGAKADSWNHGYMTELTFRRDEPVSFRVIPYVLYDDENWLHVLEGEARDTIMAYINKLSALIQQPQEVQRLFEAWCMKSGVSYAKALTHIPEYHDSVLDVDQAKKQAALRNLFWCESHDALMRGLLKLEYEGRTEEARAAIPDVLALQEIPTYQK